MWRKIEAARDRVMWGIGTDEPWVEERLQVTVQWRKPLRLDEVNRMAPTPEVRERQGRG